MRPCANAGTSRSFHEGAVRILEKLIPLSLGDVSDIGLRDDDIAAGNAVEDAGREEESNVGGQGEHEEADRGADLADDEHGDTAVFIR